jgi:hypothetical protein
MGKVIKFKAKDKYGFDTRIKPYPATKNIPKWWRQMTPYDGDGNRRKVDVLPGAGNGAVAGETNALTSASYKKCTPMLDALGSGYIIPLWADVFVKINEHGYQEINWKTTEPVFQGHGNDTTSMPAPMGYSTTAFKYLNTWIPITPKGYSILVTQPFGYRNMPFHAIPAVIDSDSSQLEFVSPLWIKEGFEGIVEKGTPMWQLTPFKRESWSSEFDYWDDGEYKKLEDRTWNQTMVGHYLKNHHFKKKYK